MDGRERRRRRFRARYLVWFALALANLVGAGYAWWINGAEDRLARQSVRLIASETYLPGTTAAVRVIVRDETERTPIAGARVAVAFSGEPAVSGVTDESGSADLRLVVPQRDGGTLLTVKVRSRRGRTSLTTTVEVRRRLRALLSCDKPRYQPGQTIHLRALALSCGGGAAGGADLTFELADPRGNKVLRRTVATDEWGVASLDFALADEPALGRYEARLLDDERPLAKRTLTIDRYVLPKFKVELRPERTWYRPGEVLRGTVDADYFFGRAVAGGAVRVRIGTFDVEPVELGQVAGKTGPNGTWSFAWRLPRAFAGTPLARGHAMLTLEVVVTDTAGHAETVSRLLPVAEQEAIVQLVPESGRLVPQVENRLYLVVTRPDGTPVSAPYQVLRPGQPTLVAKGRTDESGLAVFGYTPDSGTNDLEVRLDGRPVAHPGLPTEDAYCPTMLLLRPDRSIYRVGDTCHLQALVVGAVGACYFDLVRDGQTLLTAAAEVQDGRAEVAVPLTTDLVGTLEAGAYVLDSDGNTRRDTRRIVVAGGGELEVQATFDQPQYRPGGTARLSLDVRGPDGRPRQAAVGVDIVDESVFALEESRPGMLQVYFLLEDELRRPRVQTKDFSLYYAVGKALARPLAEADQQELAAACLAAADAEAPAAYAHPESDSYIEQCTAIQDRRDGYFAWWMPLAGCELVLLLPLLAVLLSVRCGGAHWTVVVVLLFAAGCTIAIAAMLDEPVAMLAAAVLASLPVLAACGHAAYQGEHWAAWLSGLVLVGGWVALIYTVVGQPDWVPYEIEGIINSVAAWSIAVGTLLQLTRLAGHHGTTVVVALVVLLLLPVSTLALLGLSTLGQTARDVYVTVNDSMGAPPPPGAAPGVPAAEGEAASEPDATLPETRLRQYFPETLYCNPVVVTDADGRATVEVPLADSITSWRVSALANTKAGEVGGGTADLEVFQPFFIDLDLPVALTVGDQVRVPVAVYNYLGTPQTVTIEFQPDEDKFDTDPPSRKSLVIGPHQVGQVRFPLTAAKVGLGPITVKASAGNIADAVRREVRLEPNGKVFETALNGRLVGPEEHALAVPQNVITGATRARLKVYPGIVAQLVDGLDGLLQMPYGCFEQTSSIGYPNLLVLDYLKQTKTASPEVQMRAEQLVDVCYQRLLTFEVPGGGFDWSGDPPAKIVLSAYGLLEMTDMARVHYVDPAVLERCRDWIEAQQRADGHWKLDLPMHTWSGVEADLPVTAYVTWALAETQPGDASAARGAAWLAQHLSEADDAYSVALCANALLAAEPGGAAARSTVERLAGMVHSQGETCWWPASRETMTYGYGQVGQVETTSLATYAMLASASHPDLAEAGLAWLIAQRDSTGAWGSTQATVLALKALVKQALTTQDPGTGTVVATVNDSPPLELALTDETRTQVQTLDLTEHLQRGSNTVRLEPQGGAKPCYQLVLSYALPWSAVPPDPAPEVKVAVAYDRRTLQLNGQVRATVRVTSLIDPAPAMMIVDVGIPPGFAVHRADLDALTGRGPMWRYELTGRQLILYFRELPADPQSGRPATTLSYGLTALFPVRAMVPPSRAYGYYNPDANGLSRPFEVVVSEP